MDEQERKKLENKLYRLLLELLETERSYVADLEKVGLGNNNECVRQRVLLQIWSDYSPLLTSLESNGSRQGDPSGGRKRRSKSEVNTQISNYFSRRKMSELKTSKSQCDAVEQTNDVPSLKE